MHLFKKCFSGLWIFKMVNHAYGTPSACFNIYRLSWPRAHKFSPRPCLLWVKKFILAWKAIWGLTLHIPSIVCCNSIYYQLLYSPIFIPFNIRTTQVARHSVCFSLVFTNRSMSLLFIYHNALCHKCLKWPYLNFCSMSLIMLCIVMLLKIDEGTHFVNKRLTESKQC